MCASHVGRALREAAAISKASLLKDLHLFEFEVAKAKVRHARRATPCSGGHADGSQAPHGWMCPPLRPCVAWVRVWGADLTAPVRRGATVAVAQRMAKMNERELKNYAEKQAATEVKVDEAKLEIEQVQHCSTGAVYGVRVTAALTGGASAAALYSSRRIWRRQRLNGGRRRSTT